MTLGSVIAKNESLDACYGGSHASNWPSTVYLHLFANDPTAGGMEITGGGYAPVAITNDTMHWPTASAGLKTNGVTETLPVSTGAWSAPATFFWLSNSSTQLLPPSAPVVTTHGTAGTTNYQYVITTLNAAGESTASGIGVTTTGNATLTGSNYNIVTWSSVTGATGYNLYKLVSGAFVLLGSNVSSPSNDTGGATTTQTPPLSNTTMTLLDGGPLAVPIRILTAGYIVSFPANSIVIGD